MAYHNRLRTACGWPHNVPWWASSPLRCQAHGSDLTIRLSYQDPHKWGPKHYRNVWNLRIRPRNARLATRAICAR